MQTIVELPGYQKRAEGLLSTEERQEIIEYLAATPSAGVLLQGTGGVRKVRWSRGASGKSGGVRVIYFYHNQAIPLFLLTVYSKGERDNLTKEERNALKGLTDTLVKTYGRG